MLEVDNLDDEPKALRIAIVSETWPPEINGVAITLHRLAVELQKRHHSVQVIRPRQGTNNQVGLAGTFDEYSHTWPANTSLSPISSLACRPSAC